MTEYVLVPKDAARRALPLVERHKETALQFIMDCGQIVEREGVDAEALGERRRQKMRELRIWSDLEASLLEGRTVREC